MRFSQRIGHTPIRTAMQVKSMDDPLTNGLWNVLSSEFHELNASHSQERAPKSRLLYHRIWRHFLDRPTDTLRDWIPENYDTLRQWYFKASWAERLDLCEFLSGHLDLTKENSRSQEFRRTCNEVLEHHVSAYRFVGSELAPVTSSEEVSAVEQAIAAAQQFQFSSTASHLQAAINLLSDRQQPDYRNSVKESISAVEATASQIAGQSKADLGSALSFIEKTRTLHPALKQGFSKLYGYTSDNGGIRHALMDESTVDQTDAKFMLIACSAFVHYLIDRSKVT